MPISRRTLKPKLFTIERVPEFVAQVRKALNHRLNRYRKPLPMKKRPTYAELRAIPTFRAVTDWYAPDGIAP